MKLPYERRSHRENWQLPKTSLFSKSDDCCVLAGKSIYDHDKAYSVLRILKIDKFHVFGIRLPHLNIVMYIILLSYFHTQFTFPLTILCPA